MGNAARKATERMVAERERTGRGTATVERLTKPNAEVETTQSGVQRVSESPLELLWKDARITRREYQAGEKYAEEHYIAGLDPSPSSVNWDATGGGFGPKAPSMYSSQRIADARLNWRKLEKDMRGLNKAVLDHALIHREPFAAIGGDLFGERNEHYARAAGRVAVRMALSSLADYFGM